MHMYLEVIYFYWAKNRYLIYIPSQNTKYKNQIHNHKGDNFTLKLHYLLYKHKEKTAQAFDWILVSTLAQEFSQSSWK